ncbi:MAG: asparagine synthase (glutamine-hydrolyzing) [Phycisphaeraceae bacterium]
MCGWLTIIGDRYAQGFDRALDSLASRGPDERGDWHEQDVHLGHRRLSVIDLTAGHQPMHSPDGRYVLVYNGEVYNFQSLRKELETLGHPFKTHCDTEVLLAGYVEWGREVLPRLDGMFAFAIWDRRERTLFAARDRFGIKPLFYSTEGGLVAASTVRPFFELRDFPKRLDYEALREYLAVQSIPSPMSILRDVRSLPPASWLSWSKQTKRIETGRYWNIPQPDGSTPDYNTLVERADAALTESVRRQLVADVPLGAFLSGGIDSSLMVHYMSQTSSHPVKTFTVRFDQKAEYDESRYARVVAKHYGCEHHELDAREIDADRLTDALTDLDQPLADPAYLPLRELCALTREHVTVAIAGDGGDELFGGYPRFLKGEEAYRGRPLWNLLRRMGLLPPALRRRALQGIEGLLWDRVKFGPFPGTRKDMAALLQPQAIQACDINRTMQHWLALAQQYHDPIDTDALMRADLWTYLSENCLTKSDRASMAFSLEARVPMLGNPVVDLVLPLHADLKLAHGLKSVLTDLCQRHLPREVWDRPKHGFSVPLINYFKGNWKQRCEDWVNRCEQLAPFLNQHAVQRRWAACLRGRGDVRSMYTLIALLAWLDRYPVRA